MVMLCAVATERPVRQTRMPGTRSHGCALPLPLPFPLFGEAAGFPALGQKETKDKNPHVTKTHPAANRRDNGSSESSGHTDPQAKFQVSGTIPKSDVFGKQRWVFGCIQRSGKGRRYEGEKVHGVTCMSACPTRLARQPEQQAGATRFQ